MQDGWERRVRLVRRELIAARDGVQSAGAGRLLLNVGHGVPLDVVVERTAPTMWGYSLSGRVAGRNVGFVTLVVHKEAVAGAIWTPDSAYELSYVADGVHTLRHTTNAPVECSGALPSDNSAVRATPQGRTDDGAVVDILVVWTSAVEDRYGGRQTQVRSRVDMLVAYANDALERSGAFVSLNLVGAEKVNYSETDTGDWRADSLTTLSRLIASDDGHMDFVHDRRNVVGADLVYLLTKIDNGSGQILGSFGIGTLPDNGAIFAHQIGHNFGILHERHEFVNTVPQAYQHGFTTEGCDVTIMSYGTECRGRGDRGENRIPFYASPWRYGLHDGRALGTTRFSKERGARGRADAVLTLNRNRHAVANFRPSRNGR